MATLVVVIATTILPFIRLGEVFGFSRLPISFLVFIAIIIMGYIVTAEMAKMIFYKKVRL